jgi:hypothetical protein
MAFVHRIGRAAASGIAISLVAAAERGVIERIERYNRALYRQPAHPCGGGRLGAAYQLVRPWAPWSIQRWLEHERSDAGQPPGRFWTDRQSFQTSLHIKKGDKIVLFYAD